MGLENDVDGVDEDYLLDVVTHHASLAKWPGHRADSMRLDEAVANCVERKIGTPSIFAALMAAG